MYNQQPITKNGRGRYASALPAESTPAEAPELGHAISLRDVLRTTRRWFWVIALVVALLIAAALAYNLKQTPMYEASTTILVGQNSGIIQNPSEVQSLEQITETMAQAVVTRPILEGVVQQLNLQTPPEDLAGNMRAEKVGKTQFIKVTYTDASPQKAQQVVNAVGEEFSNTVAKLQGSAAAATADTYQQPGGSTGGVVIVPTTTSNVITATVWEHAEVPGAPVRPNPKRDVLFALVLGLMLGAGLAFVLEHLTTTDKWRSLDEVEPTSGVPILGVIPK